MKTRYLCLSAALFFAAAAGADAQDTRDGADAVNQSEFYVKQVTFDKIFEAPKGFIIQYRTGVLGDKKVRIALPYEWFIQQPSEGKFNAPGPVKAELIRIGDGKLWPHLVVYYKNGEIDHMRLYVSKRDTHPAWGHAENTPAVDKLFSEADNWKL